MLDDDAREAVVSDLKALVRWAPWLDQMIVPSTPASGSNAGVRAVAPGPRSPVREHAFSVKLDAGVLLRRIIRAVCARSMVRGPRRPDTGPTPLKDLAGWLLEHVEELADHEQAADAVVVINQQARRVADLVDPPPANQTPTPQDGGPGGVDAPAGQVQGLPPGAGKRCTPEQASKAMKYMQYCIDRALGASPRVIRDWMEAGHVRVDTFTAATPLVFLEDVVRMAEGMAQRVAESRRVVG